MGVMKTPGVYIVEKNAFPNSVVEVATAVPAFIGYTERADNKGRSLLNQPFRISSLAEFHTYFGFGPKLKFGFAAAAPAAAGGAPAAGGAAPAPNLTLVDNQGKRNSYMLSQKQGKYALYYSMQLFFQNGGGPCYIVSVDTYQDDDSIDVQKLKDGVNTLEKEMEPTMVVVPDAIRLKDSDTCIGVQQHMLNHCGNVMKNRFAILDVYNGFNAKNDGDPVGVFRNSLGINFLNFGAAYYPWVNTTITQASHLTYENFDAEGQKTLQTLLMTELNVDALTKDADKSAKDKGELLKKIIDSITATDWSQEKGYPKDPGKQQDDFIAQCKDMLNKSLISLSPSYNLILTEIAKQVNLLPPSAAMAGVYAMVDNNRGVWKAPANVSLNSVISPAVNVTHADQEDLNVTPQGKSINAIRTFVGEGTLVWGARTLDGNSQDWRYINVRRTMIMLEESVRLATKAYVFEPNVGATWLTIRSMISGFLTGIWKRGGLAGAVPTDAFSVHVGLGETMTPDDILEGILRVTVLVAISRPAEFIEITFQQQMQKS